MFPGNTIRIKATFKDADGVAVNPTTVTLKIKPPTGSTVEYTGVQLTNPSTGVWHVLYTPTLVGHYDVRWETGTPSIASESGFDVQASRI